MNRWLWAILAVGLAFSADAQQKDTPAEEIDAIVPLVNPDAPELVFWFCADPALPADKTRPLEDYINRRLFDRTDIRLIGRKQAEEKLPAAAALAACRCDDRCLTDIGRAVGAQRIIGALLEPSAEGFRLTLKSFILAKPPKLLNSVVEGQSSLLLANGIDDAIKAIFENDAQHAPLAAGVVSPTVKPKRPQPAPVEAKITAPDSSAGTGAGRTVPVEKLTARAAPAGAEESRLVVEEAAPAPRPGFLRRHPWSAIAAGTAVVSLSTAVALGALSKKIEDEQHIQYDPGRDATGRNYATAANALFGVAGGAAAAAVLLFFLVENDRPEQFSISVLPGGAAFQAKLGF